MKRQVWLNLQTGEFSNSWLKESLSEGTLEFVMNQSKEPELSHWKLIEYECLSDQDFEFCNLMKLR